jgi:hypothetical protein
LGDSDCEAHTGVATIASLKLFAYRKTLPELFTAIAGSFHFIVRGVFDGRKHVTAGRIGCSGTLA